MVDVFVPHGYASKTFWPQQKDDVGKGAKPDTKGYVEIKPFSVYQVDHPHVIRKRYGHLGASPRCRASATDSMDLVRKVLQPAINQDIIEVFKKYVLVFRNAAQNVVENMNIVPFATATQNDLDVDSLAYKTCCDALEHCKSIFDSRKTKKEDKTETATVSVSAKSVASSLPSHLISMKRVPSPDFPWSKRIVKNSPRRSLSPIPRKRGRPTPTKRYGSPQRSLKRENWDPSKLTTETNFVMGTKANKALGLGATRGRIYMKHPDLFKYSSDPEDKKWMIKNNCMVATGGKNTFIMIADNIYDLLDNEYKDSPGTMHEEMQVFTLPEFILQKMRTQMIREKKLSEKLNSSPAVTKTETRIKSGTPTWVQSSRLEQNPGLGANQDRSTQHPKRPAAERAAAAITASSGEGETDNDPEGLNKDRGQMSSDDSLAEISSQH